MIEKRSGFVYAVVVAAAVPSRPPIHSFIPLLHSLESPPFFSLLLLPTILPISDLPAHAIIPSQTTCTCTYTIRHKEGFGASYITYVLYCTLHVPYMYIHHTTQKRLPSPSSSGK